MMSFRNEALASLKSWCIARNYAIAQTRLRTRLRRGSCRFQPRAIVSRFSATANNSGFTILETIVAMGIVAGVVTILLMMQSAVLQQVVRVSDRVERVFMLRSFLHEARSKTQPQAVSAQYEKEIPNPLTRLHYQRMPPEPQSVLASSKGICIERVSAHWQRSGEALTESLVTTTYIPTQRTGKT